MVGTPWLGIVCVEEAMVRKRGGNGRRREGSRLEDATKGTTASARSHG